MASEEYIKNILANQRLRTMQGYLDSSDSAFQAFMQQNADAGIQDFDNPEFVEAIARSSEATGQADALLAQAVNKRKYGSIGEYTAAAQKRIQQKQQALGLLQQAEQPEATTASGTFVDPVTGNVMSAASFLNASPKEKERYAAERAATLFQTFDEHIKSRGDIREPGYAQMKSLRHEVSRGKGMFKKSKSWFTTGFRDDADYEKYFGAEGKAIKEAAESGMLDMSTVMKENKDILYQHKRAAFDLFKSKIADEAWTRAQTVQEFVQQQGLEQERSREQMAARFAETQKRQQELQQSIEKEKLQMSQATSGPTASLGPRPVRVAFDAVSGTEGGARPE